MPEVRVKCVDCGYTFAIESFEDIPEICPKCGEENFSTAFRWIFIDISDEEEYFIWWKENRKKICKKS